MNIDPFVLVYKSIFFFFLPFILGIVIPSIAAPLLVKKIVFPKKTFPIRHFSFMLVMCGVLAAIVWHTFISGHLYFRWDAYLMPFTYLYFDGPNLEESADWIIPGLTSGHLWLLHKIFLVTSIVLSGLGIKTAQQRIPVHYFILTATVLFAFALIFSWVFPTLISGILFLIFQQG